MRHKNIISFTTTFFILVICLVSSCKKKGLTYDSPNSVYFTSDSTVYSFVEKASTVARDTVKVTVKLIGNKISTDREVAIIIDSSTAVEGTDFTVLTPTVVKKDSSYATLRISINRTASLKTNSKSIWFRLKNTSDFLIDSTSYPHLRHKIRFTDKLEKPSWWNTYFPMYNYSDTRMQFYIDVFGSTKAPTTSTSTGVGLSLAAVIYALKDALNIYNATHSIPLSDEFGVITWYYASYE
ncbi:MAG: DUF4843 domain-containing protein [Lacibacter sp.]